MYLLNSAIVTSVSEAIGSTSALKLVNSTDTPSPCGPSGGKIGNLIAKTRISRIPSRKAGIA